jgi:hypothetical protein
MENSKIEKELALRDKEINKLKSFCTRLVKALKENKENSHLPSTNWSKEDSEETISED